MPAAARRSCRPSWPAPTDPLQPLHGARAGRGAPRRWRRRAAGAGPARSRPAARARSGARAGGGGGGSARDRPGGDVAVDQEVDVERARAEARAARRPAARSSALAEGEHRVRGERGAAEGGGVQEVGLRHRRDRRGCGRGRRRARGRGRLRAAAGPRPASARPDRSPPDSLDMPTRLPPRARATTAGRPAQTSSSSSSSSSSSRSASVEIGLDQLVVGDLRLDRRVILLDVDRLDDIRLAPAARRLAGRRRVRRDRVLLIGAALRADRLGLAEVVEFRAAVVAVVFGSQFELRHERLQSVRRGRFRGR